jgi:hypothetical protein
MWNKYLILFLGCLVLGACAKQTRSISHSGWQEKPSYCGDRNRAASDPGFQYRGELNEFDVLGITRDEMASEADIRHALDSARRVRLAPGSSILLIQSGALIPDAVMVSELSKHFSVVPFSGIPSENGRSSDPDSYSRNLRLAAARGGNDKILCYWGMLESASERLPTKTVSWVPIVNWVLPDENQHMRVRLKLALLDVRTGNWALISPRSYESQRISIRPRREAVDQKQVERLKEKAYVSAVQELVQVHSQDRDTL